MRFHSLRQIKEHFQNAPFKTRLFYLFGLMGFFSSAFSYISALVNKLPQDAVNASFACTLIMVLNIMLYLFTGKQKFSGVLCCISLDFFMFPALFMVSGGVYSGMPIYFILGIISAALMLDGIAKWLVVGISMLIDSFCIWLFYTHEDFFLIIPKDRQLGDVISSYWMVCLFFMVILSALTREFEEKQNKLQEYNQYLKDKNQLDALTGLYNQHFASTTIASLCAQEGSHFSIIMLDIDFFKLVNDSYGHLRGNDVLIRVAQILTEHISEQQYATRYGGEEFLLILKECPGQQAFQIAESIRQAIWNDKSLTRLTEGGLTISGGIAQYHPGMTSTELIDLADKRLYQAKESGRNAMIL